MSLKTTDDRAGNAAHAAEHDDREAADLDVIAADVRADVRERQPEQNPGDSAQD